MRKKFRKITAVILTVAMAFSVAIPAFAEEISLDNNATLMIASVNDVTITQDELNSRKVLYDAFGSQKTMQDVFDKLIEEKAVISQAIDLGVEPTKQEIAERVNENNTLVENNADFFNNYSDVLNRLGMSWVEYVEKYETYFTYYQLCLENLTKELYNQADNRGLNRYDYVENERTEWKNSLQVVLFSDDLTVDLTKNIVDWDAVKAHYENENVQLNNVSPRADLPVGTTIGGRASKNCVVWNADFGTKNFPVVFCISGNAYEESGGQWLGATDIYMYRQNEYAYEIDALFDSAMLTSVKASRNGSVLSTDYLSLFSHGLNNQYITEYDMVIQKGCYGGQLGSTGNYTLTAYSTVFIDTYAFSVEVTTDGTF